jgi:hypothetical protein
MKEEEEETEECGSEKEGEMSIAGYLSHMSKPTLCRTLANREMCH